MELNHILFPAPPTQMKPQDFKGDLLYIPRYYTIKQKKSKRADPNARAATEARGEGGRVDTQVNSMMTLTSINSGDSSRQIDESRIFDDGNESEINQSQITISK